MQQSAIEHTSQLYTPALSRRRFLWCDRLMAEGSDRKKGYLPKFERDDYSKELSNLAEVAEVIFHSPDPVNASKETLNPSVVGKLKQFFRQLLK
ncbi:MAG: hypothetical protein P5681_25075 [Limnospira sp. PMC 894.15]|uniref:Uncharacterized protein n=1 Tax=Limnospira fusiformis PMC 851.14 TaxID=2219512 RepID=A0ABU9EIK9_LIMFS|nr:MULTISPECIES: hypothetical protein [Limnospira]MDT9191011.1 hypothetical protein [Limnospira sp. PMC 894.15]